MSRPNSVRGLTCQRQHSNFYSPVTLVRTFFQHLLWVFFLFNRRFGFESCVPRRGGRWVSVCLLLIFSILACLRSASAQNFASDAIVANRPLPPRAPVASALIFEGLVSYGNYNLFASGTGDKLYTSGVEYDRNSWGYALHAERDYVAEVLPLVLLNQSVKTTLGGFPMSPQRKTVPGIGFSPVGIRLLWRGGQTIEPYLESKGGLLFFTQKAIEKDASYGNFSIQNSLGVLIHTRKRFDLRIGLYSDFHFSDAFIVPVNPGLDVMNANFGLVYRLGQRHPGAE